MVADGGPAARSAKICQIDSTVREKGTLVSWYDMKNCGFLKAPGQEDCFVHRSALPTGVVPQVGLNLSWKVIPGRHPGAGDDPWA